MSLRSEPSLANRTTTIPPGSAPVTTPSPNAAWTMSSPIRNTWPPPPSPAPPPVASAEAPAAGPPGGGPRRARPRGDAAGRQAGGLTLGLVGQLARDLVDEARAHPER